MPVISWGGGWPFPSWILGVPLPWIESGGLWVFWMFLVPPPSGSQKLPVKQFCLIWLSLHLVVWRWVQEDLVGEMVLWECGSALPNILSHNEYRPLRLEGLSALLHLPSEDFAACQDTGMGGLSHLRNPLSGGWLWSCLTLCIVSLSLTLGPDSVCQLPRSDCCFCPSGSSNGHCTSRLRCYGLHRHQSAHGFCLCPLPSSVSAIS